MRCINCGWTGEPVCPKCDIQGTLDSGDLEITEERALELSGLTKAELQEALDGLVHDVVSTYGSEVNNEGPAAQLLFAAAARGKDAIEAWLSQLKG